MARRRGLAAIFRIAEAEPDTRPTGSLLFADPAAAQFPRQVHTFNDPPSGSASGTCEGIQSMGRYTGDAWANMNRKRGVDDGDEA